MASSQLTSSGALPLLRPVAVLAGWTFVMETWMYATRLPAIGRHGVSYDPAQVRADMDTKLPISIRQVADNYNHLHEQPTTFYAVALALAALGDGRHPRVRAAAWGYVGLRVVHSLFQATVNRVVVRFQLFLGSSVVLAGLTARLLKLVF